MFQQPSYNPFEMKYRNVNEYPLEEAANKENILNSPDPYAIKSAYQSISPPSPFSFTKTDQIPSPFTFTKSEFTPYTYQTS
jgi:hypothetical protein